MQRGDIVYLPYKNGFIRYKIRKVLEDNDLLVITFKSGITNYVTVDEVLSTDDFTKIYKDGIIYE